jgi:hypothetical protein
MKTPEPILSRIRQAEAAANQRDDEATIAGDREAARAARADATLANLMLGILR